MEQTPKSRDAIGVVYDITTLLVVSVLLLAVIRSLLTGTFGQIELTLVAMAAGLILARKFTRVDIGGILKLSKELEKEHADLLALRWRLEQTQNITINLPDHVRHAADRLKIILAKTSESNSTGIPSTATQSNRGQNPVMHQAQSLSDEPDYRQACTLAATALLNSLEKASLGLPTRNSADPGSLVGELVSRGMLGREWGDAVMLAYTTCEMVGRSRQYVPRLYVVALLSEVDKITKHLAHAGGMTLAQTYMR